MHINALENQIEPLTPREVEMLYLLFDFDLDASEIAAKLCVTKSTVNFHINNIIAKLRAANRADAVCRYARANPDYRKAFTDFLFHQSKN